jgi:hypothetical protein
MIRRESESLAAARSRGRQECRSLKGCFAACGVLFAVGVFAATPSVALAATPVTLYVSSQSGTETSGCTSPGMGACRTINEGIEAAELLTGRAVTVKVAASKTAYKENLNIGDPTSDNPSLTIVGAGALSTSLDGSLANSSGITVTAGNVAVSGLSIINCTTDFGGGVYNDGSLTLSDDIISDDTADFAGGGIYNDGKLVLTDDTFSFDKALDALDGGGAVYNDSGATATLTNDTLLLDYATNYGGGLENVGTAILTDDTIDDDQATNGGGIANFKTLTVRTSIFDYAGCYESGGAAVITSGGYNVESDNSCGFGSKSKTNDQTIGLGFQLQRNGSTGPETLAIASGSSALDEVPAKACTVKTDERGRKRPGFFGQTSCDAGAFEFQSSAPSAPQQPYALPANRSITITWNAPSSNGGIAISSYRVYCAKTHPVSTKGTPSAVEGPTTTSVKFSGLANGSELYCAVVAVNAQGRSRASATVNTFPDPPITVFVSHSGMKTTGCASAGNGACPTLAEGIDAAELHVGRAATVVVAASPVSYKENLNIADPASANPELTIEGGGAKTTTLDGSKAGSDVLIDAGFATISRLSIIDGAGANGGGVDNSGTLTLADDTLSGDTTTYVYRSGSGGNGGGVYNSGTLTLTDDTLSDDVAKDDGGGVYNSGTLTLTHDTLSGDSTTYNLDGVGGVGGGVFNSGTLTLSDSTVSGDSALQDGGGVYNGGTAALRGDTVSGDTLTGGEDYSYGGGVYNSGTLTLTDSTLSDDTAPKAGNDDIEGGGVYNARIATLTDDTLSGDSAPAGGGVSSLYLITLTDDTFSGDTATSQGGGFNNFGGVFHGGGATLTDDTFSGDSAPLGGGLLNEGTASLSADTLSGDSATYGGGVYNGQADAALTISASILDSAGCYNYPSSTDTIADGGYNVESDNSCGFGSTSKVASATIDLAVSLGHNGSSGPETLAIKPGSSAFEEVPKKACTIKNDERGRHRPGFFGQSSCDAGAFEFQTHVPSAPIKVRATPADKSITLTWTSPSANGGLAISGYSLYCSTTRSVSTKGIPAVKTGASATRAKVSGLTNGTKYFCVVIAVNAEGRSPPSLTVSATPR